ncbi:MAG: hypothetical protein ACRDGQ_07750, partial [Candidatus Limnocylindrales bacterium]
ILCLVAACGSTTPSAVPTQTVTPTAVPTPSPSPLPTPVPTPLPSLPPLDVSAFEPGWTLAATDSNAGPVHETAILSTIGPQYAVAVVCVGEGELVVTLRAAGGDLQKDHPDGVDAGSVTVQCTNLTPTVTEFDSTELPAWIGVSISPSAAGPQHIQYRIAVGTAG